jgi:cytochrome c-type biogenesis protein CcmF
MAAAPALPWRSTSRELLQGRLAVPAWCGAVTLLAALAFGVRSVGEVVVYGLGAFALAGIVRQLALGARARRAAEGVGRPVALVRSVRGNPRLYGGLVVHVGVVLIAIALATSGASSSRREVRLSRGESATVAGYRVTYLGSETTRSAQKTSVHARVRIEHGDDVLGVYAPAISTFPGKAGGFGTPSVRNGLLRDVYLTLVSSPNQRGRVTLAVAVNPMVVWLWIGGGVVALGTAVALAPGLRRRPVRRDGADAVPTPARSPEPEPALEDEEVRV